MRLGSALAVAQGRAERRCWGRRASRRLAAILALCAGAPAPAIADDSQPAQWIIDANAVALQHAPPPPEKPVICIVVRVSGDEVVG